MREILEIAFFGTLIGVAMGMTSKVMEIAFMYYVLPLLFGF